ncbi:MAG: thioredoxin [Gemmatimonadaceae bacterium]
MLLDRPWVLVEDSFARTIAESTLPILVDFYADWCGPCKMMAPAVDELALRHQGRALVAKLNTDLAPNTSEQFQIRSIPTTIVFRGGAEQTRVSGAMPLPALEKLLESGLQTV